MRLRGDRWRLRLTGGLFGAGSLGIGLFALFGGDGVSPVERSHAVGFGVTAIVIGLVALIGSTAAADIRGLWYCSPERWKMFLDKQWPPQGGSGR